MDRAGAEAGQALAEHRGIDHVSFTGSPDTGRRVAQAAAAHHCPVTLELGGKSPQLVFADADIDAALPVLVNAIVRNAGQTCSAGGRELIESSIYHQVVGMLADRFNALRAGPAHDDLDLGPLVSRRQQQRVWDFLSEAQTSGLDFAAQGVVVDDAPPDGFYQAPVLLADVPPAHRLAQEEIFGPVLAATRFDDEAQAVAIANGTPYGLVAGSGRDGARQLRVARQLRAGQVFVNNYGAGGGVELPFGGPKRLRPREGLRGAVRVHDVEDHRAAPRIGARRAAQRPSGRVGHDGRSRRKRRRLGAGERGQAVVLVASPARPEPLVG